MSGPVLIATLLVVLFAILALALLSEIAFWLYIVGAVVLVALVEIWSAVVRRRR